MSNQTPEQIQADIERQREALAATVDELTGKLDVKSRAADKVHELKDGATTADGKPRPELLGAAAGLAVGLVVLAIWQHRERT